MRKFENTGILVHVGFIVAILAPVIRSHFTPLTFEFSNAGGDNAPIR